MTSSDNHDPQSIRGENQVRRRANRTARRLDRRVRLNPNRDPQILLAVGKMKLARTRDILRLFFGSKATANKRLRKLMDVGLLRCFVTDLSADNIYALTPRGIRYLAEHCGSVAESFTAPRSIERMNLGHLFAQNSVRIGLALAASRTPGAALKYFKPEWTLTAGHGRIRGALVPDAMFELEVDGMSRVFCLEVDLGTEHPRYVGKTKVGRYRQLLLARLPLFGELFDRVLFVGPTVRRLRNLARVVMSENCGAKFLFGLCSSFEHELDLGTGIARATDLLEQEKAVPRGTAFCRGLVDGLQETTPADSPYECPCGKGNVGSGTIGNRSGSGRRGRASSGSRRDT